MTFGWICLQCFTLQPKALQNLHEAIHILHLHLVGGIDLDAETWVRNRSLQAARLFAISRSRVRGFAASHGIQPRQGRETISPSFLRSHLWVHCSCLRDHGIKQARSIEKAERSYGNELDGSDEQASRNEWTTPPSCRGKFESDRLEVGARGVETSHPVRGAPCIWRRSSKRLFGQSRAPITTTATTGGNDRSSAGRCMETPESKPGEVDVTQRIHPRRDVTRRLPQKDTLLCYLCWVHKTKSNKLHPGSEWYARISFLPTPSNAFFLVMQLLNSSIGLNGDPFPPWTSTLVGLLAFVRFGCMHGMDFYAVSTPYPSIPFVPPTWMDGIPVCFVS